MRGLVVLRSDGALRVLCVRQIVFLACRLVCRRVARWVSSCVLTGHCVASCLSCRVALSVGELKSWRPLAGAVLPLAVFPSPIVIATIRGVWRNIRPSFGVFRSIPLGIDIRGIVLSFLGRFARLADADGALRVPLRVASCVGLAGETHGAGLLGCWWQIVFPGVFWLLTGGL